MSNPPIDVQPILTQALAFHQAKDFAKANMDHLDGSLPKEVAAVLYYASISAALTRLDERISQLKDAELERGLRWAKDQAWVDKQIQQLPGVEVAAPIAYLGYVQIPSPEMGFAPDRLPDS